MLTVIFKLFVQLTERFIYWCNVIYLFVDLKSTIVIEMIQENKEKKQDAPAERNPSTANQSIDEIKKKISEKEKIIEDYTNQLKRLQAEFENYVKRVGKERSEFEDFVKQKVFAKFLSFADDLECAVAQLKQQKSDELVKGVEIVLNNFHRLLKEEHVCAIEAKGKKPDPYMHEVILTVENSSIPEGAIAEEIQKGYMFKDKVLRPSKVVICKCHTDKNR